MTTSTRRRRQSVGRSRRTPTSTCGSHRVSQTVRSHSRTRRTLLLTRSESRATLTTQFRRLTGASRRGRRRSQNWRKRSRSAAQTKRESRSRTIRRYRPTQQLGVSPVPTGLTFTRATERSRNYARRTSVYHACRRSRTRNQNIESANRRSATHITQTRTTTARYRRTSTRTAKTKPS